MSRLSESFKIHALIVFLSAHACLVHTATHSEVEITKFLAGSYESKYSELCTESVVAHFAYETNITDENQRRATETVLKSAEYDKRIYSEWFKDIDVSSIRNITMRKMLQYLKLEGTSALNKTELSNLTDTTGSMNKIYSTAKICPYKNQKCNLDKHGWNLEPEMESVMSESTDYDELLYVWKSWRDASGKKMRTLYKTYVELNNRVAKLNGFKDAGEMWRFSFDTPDFVNVVDALWKQVAPMYKQLHSYAGDKLRLRYGGKLNTSDGLLPAHILGNMWAQTWSDLDDLLRPFPNEPVVNVTKALNDQKYTVERMFDTANEFYMSLGLPNIDKCYGPKAMIVRPKDREVTCHASAWDFCDKTDFRIKMCTEVNEEDFITIHHEMGHIMYYELYKDQLIHFRKGANPGFHEAVGDTISLSVQSVKHLKRINLIAANFTSTNNSEINTLLSQALAKVAFMPFGLLIDKWRWDVFQGVIHESEWNKQWWHYREVYQLIKAPVERTENDFDPGAKFHVPGDSQYISYFISHILQFQFYRALCIAAGEYNPRTKSPPLHQCDFYESKAAGKLLRDGLSLGSSKPWPQVLKVMTGSDKLSADAFLEYFAPLSEYLDTIGYSSARSVYLATPLCALLALLLMRI